MTKMMQKKDVYVSDEGQSLTFEQCVKESCDADSSFKEGIIERLLEVISKEEHTQYEGDFP